MPIAPETHTGFEMDPAQLVPARRNYADESSFRRNYEDETTRTNSHFAETTRTN